MEYGSAGEWTGLVPSENTRKIRADTYRQTYSGMPPPPPRLRLSYRLLLSGIGLGPHQPHLAAATSNRWRAGKFCTVNTGIRHKALRLSYWLDEVRTTRKQ